MVCLYRNLSPFYYAPTVGKAPVLDADGRKTGETEVLFGKPVKCRANISAARGAVQAEQFGENAVYDKVLTLADTATPIDEYTVLWIDRKPELDGDGTLARNPDGTAKTPHDYIVTRKAVSLNSVSLAVQKVDVT